MASASDTAAAIQLLLALASDLGGKLGCTRVQMSLTEQLSGAADDG